MATNKQGVRDLDDGKQPNGRKLRSVCIPHLPGPLERLGTRLVRMPWVTIDEVDVHGCRCLKCGEIVGPTV